MKRHLFWKILVGFWVTFILMTQGTWLLFTLFRPLPEQSEYARGMARMSVEAAASAIRRGGETAFKAQVVTWPAKNQIEVRSAQTRSASAGADQQGQPLAVQTVKSPDGKSYIVSAFPRHSSRSHGPLGIPPEVLTTGIVAGLVFSLILAWYLTRPIEQIRKGFDRLARGDFSVRLGPAMGRRTDEIADLSHDFDKMAAQLGELVLARDRLLADVSHELRTPLARLNLAIGLARQDPSNLDDALNRIGGEAGKLDEMVGELLSLAKLESNPDDGEDYFNFADVVESVVRDARYEAAPKRVEIALDIRPDSSEFEWVAKGSGKLISRAVENIVRNAVRYSPDGGTVNVTLSQADDKILLTIDDNGPGVPDQTLSTIFDPFSKSADGFGFGLGLAIARRAIAVHGGSISAQNRKPSGLRMTVTFPSSTIDSA